jgi:hypothetical protein
MRIARLSGEQNLLELVRALYDISGPQAARLSREAEAALLKANPHLRELGTRLGPAVIVVPDVTGTRPRPGRDVEPTTMPGRQLVDDTRRAVGELQKRLEAAGRRAAEEGKQTVELLQSREVKALAEKIPAVRDALPAIGEATKARLAELEALKAFQDQNLPELLRDLEELSKRLST